MENHTKTATINPQIVNWGFLITNFQYICQGFIDSDFSADFPHLYLSFYPMKTIPNGEFGIPEVFSLSTKTDTIMFYTLYLLLRRKWEKEGRKEGKEGGREGRDGGGETILDWEDWISSKERHIPAVVRYLRVERRKNHLFLKCCEWVTGFELRSRNEG